LVEDRNSKNRNFGQKKRNFNQKFGKKSKFWSKIKILIKNRSFGQKKRNFGQKSKFFVKYFPTDYLGVNFLNIFAKKSSPDIYLL